MREINETILSIWILILYIAVSIPGVSAEINHCYTSGTIFGIIVLSVFATLFVIAVTLTLIWFLWTKNLLNLDIVLKTISKSKGESPDVRKVDLESAKEDYAFDNPYFEDDEKAVKTATDGPQRDTIISVKGEDLAPNRGLVETSDDNSRRNCQPIQRNGQILNNPFIKSLPLSTVFSNVPFKKSKPENSKSMDDHYLLKRPERLTVELTGRDFTGLGFNISGNMKDGIFVKDVLSRGPANESGKVKAGDRILGVSVSFEGVVFEDAVAILSYASPYNVIIELEKCDQSSAIERMSSTLSANKNSKSNTDKSLLHPLYRSHSFDDLTQIKKEMSLSERSTSSAGRNVINKIKTQILRIHPKTLPPDLNKDVDRETDIKAKRFHIRGTTITTELPTSVADQSQPIQALRDEVGNDKSESEVKNDSQEELLENQSNKKAVTPAKRKGKAPQPPVTAVVHNLSLESLQNGIQTSGETIETTAQVHNEEVHTSSQSNDTIIVLTKEEVSPECKENNHLDSVVSDEPNPSDARPSLPPPSVPNRAQTPQRVQSPSGKTKSSSMSDLTNNNRSDKLQSVLLERAVSLDMNGHSLPEENLSHLHGKNLILNDESMDSMPIVSWSLTKQNNNVDSSESTLNEINQSLNNTRDSTGLILNEITCEEQTLASDLDIDLQDKPQITSTPLKCETSSEGDLEQILERSDQTSETPKDVIELSANELNDVMMSHKEFLSKKASIGTKANNVNKSSHQKSRIPTKIPVIEPQYESLDFESWSYVSEDENSNLKEPENNSTFYKTALDISIDKDREESAKSRRLPEVAGITLKDPNKRPVSANVFISRQDSIDTHDLHDSSFSSTSSSPSK